MSDSVPDFREDGYLPYGLYPVSLAEVISRFGGGSPQRRYLCLRLKRWVQLAKSVRAKRLFVNGSFVTSKSAPNDIDAVILLPDDFGDMVQSGDDDALLLEYMLLTRQPEEIFAAEDEQDWLDWLDFFHQTREEDSHEKGLIEVLYD